MIQTQSAAEERRMKATVWRLFFCQALMNATMVGQVAMGAMIGHSLSGDQALATLPMAVQMTAVMAASMVAATWINCSNAPASISNA